ncbi:MAG: hypothetical protein H0T75_14315 [Rhizobiales bacterium]|nr:hypothetical protein [Hyphomicrobiales bacterium]
MPKPDPLVARRSSLERRVSGQPGRLSRRRLLSGAVAGAGLAALAGGGSRT